MLKGDRKDIMKQNNFIKQCRIDAGLTQEQLAEKMEVSITAVQNWESGRTNIELKKYLQLAEIFNVPVEKLIKERLIEEDKKRVDRWPDFLFDEDINSVINTLHLNLAQQDLLGILHIYGAEYLNNKEMELNTFNEDLKLVPYSYIEKVGSIRFLDQAAGLYNVIRYVKTDFLLKILRQNPEAEFNVKKMSRDQICEFIDDGCKPGSLWEDLSWDYLDQWEGFDSLHFNISMKKAKIILPLLKKGPIHLADEKGGRRKTRRDVPSEVLEMCDFKKELWDEGYYSKTNQDFDVCILDGIQKVTKYHSIQKKGKEDQWYLEINEKGEQWLEWYKNAK